MKTPAHKRKKLPIFYYGEDIGDDEYEIFPLNALSTQLPEDGRTDLRCKSLPADDTVQDMYFITRDKKVLRMNDLNVLSPAPEADARKCLLYYKKAEAEAFFNSIKPPR